MDQTQLIQKVTELEKQLHQLQHATKKEHNTDVVYNTKATFGYSQLVETSGGRIVYLSGMTPWNKEMQLEEDNLLDQLDHALVNLTNLLKSRDLTIDNVVSLRFYVAKPNYYDEMQGIPGVFMKHFGKKEIECALTLIGVTGLAEPNQLIELEAIAVY